MFSQFHEFYELVVINESVLLKLYQPHKQAITKKNSGDCDMSRDEEKSAKQSMHQNKHNSLYTDFFTIIKNRC